MADVEMPLDWSDAAGAPVQPANLVLVQGTEDEVFLTFGYAAPPIAMAIQKMSDGDHAVPVKVQGGSRVSLPMRVAKELAGRLQAGVTAHEADGRKQETTQ
jgi:hypothetical protein